MYKSATRDRPNILVIILDALRARNVSSYGYPVRTTPQLDTFAGDNILFKHSYTAATWTVPSHASILSGLYLSQHRLENIQRNRQFNDSIVPLPIALRSGGYKTAAFSQNMLFDPEHHFDFFDEFHGTVEISKSHEGVGGHLGNLTDTSRIVDRVIRYLDKASRPRAFFDAIHDWIRAQDANTPFFLMANLLNIHYPWAPAPVILLRQLGSKIGYLLKSEFAIPKPWIFNSGLRDVTAMHRDVWRSLYDAAIMHVDRELGRFLSRLRQWGGWENSVVVITSDHGEMLGDYRDLVGHMLSLHDNVLHVPLIIRHPDYPSRLIVEGVVQTVDLYPSVIEWAGINYDSIPAAQLQRPSYSQAMNSPDCSAGYALAEEDYTDSYNVVGGLVGTNPRMNPHKYPRRQIAIHSATHKYIWYDDRTAEFYDLISDPLETNNLISQSDQSPAFLNLQQILEKWRTDLEVFPPRLVDYQSEISDETVNRLRGLGYIA